MEEEASYSSGEEDNTRDDQIRYEQEFLQQQQLHLYQLKALEGQLLENLISQVSNPDEPVSQEIKSEILKSLRWDMDKQNPTPTTDHSQLLPPVTMVTSQTDCDNTICPLTISPMDNISYVSQPPSSILTTPTDHPRPIIINNQSPNTSGWSHSIPNEEGPLPAVYTPSIASTEFLNLPETLHTSPLVILNHSNTATKETVPQRQSPQTIVPQDMKNISSSDITQLPRPTYSTVKSPHFHATNPTVQSIPCDVDTSYPNVTHSPKTTKTTLNSVRSPLSPRDMNTVTTLTTNPTSHSPHDINIPQSHRTTKSIVHSSLTHQDHLPDNTTSLTNETENYLEQNNKQLLISENKRLKTKCDQLQQQLHQYKSINEILEDKLKKTQRQLQRYEEEQESQEKLISMLQGRLSSTTSQLREQERTIDHLRQQLETREKELYNNLQKEKQEIKDTLHQALMKMDTLQEYNTTLVSKVQSLENQLEESESEIEHLQIILDKHKRNQNQYQSTIYQLEEEIRSLRYVNNQLHSHSTHFELSSEKLSRIGSDDNKLKFSLSPHKSTPLSIKSNETSPSSSSSRRPLTRRRWLETSEDGLVFGSPNLQVDSKTVNYEYDETCSSFPPTHSPNQSRTHSSPVDDTLEAVRRRTITSTSSVSSKKDSHSKRQSIEERVEDRLKKIKEAEVKLGHLQKEKERLESILQRAPPTGKITSELKQIRREAEHKLDNIIKEIGKVRMVLRSSVTWKK